MLFVLGITPFFIRKVRPKILFSVCQAVTFISLIGLASFLLLKSYHPDLPYLHKFNWLPMVLITFIWIMRCSGILPVIQTLLSEIYPTDIRAQSIGITQSSFMIFMALGTKFFPELKHGLGLPGLLFMYAGMCLFNFTWGILTIPDNRGKSLTKVEQTYENKNNSDETRDLNELDNPDQIFFDKANSEFK